MKKILLTVLLVFFATAAYAEIKFELTGDFFGRGSYWKNFDYVNQVEDSYMNADGECNLYPTIKVGSTELKMRIQMRDEIWGDWYSYDTAPDTSAGGFANSYPYTYNDDTGANIQIARLWLRHYFKNSHLDVGLRDGGQWATTWGDQVEARYRVVWFPRTPVGTFVLLYEKRAELGNESIEDSEKDDYMYYVGLVTKAGPVFVKPLFIYGDVGAFYPNLVRDTGIQVLGWALGLNGDLGPLGFESEFTYQQWKVEDLQDLAALSAVNPVFGAFAGAKDADIYGAYLNVWGNMEFGKPGLILTYCSWDDEGGPFGTGWGLSNGEDFESNLILGDWIDNIGSVAWQAEKDLLAMTMVKPYISDIQLPLENLSCGASFGYIMSNQKDTQWEDFSAWEADLNVTYAITENLQYQIFGGYASLSFDEDAPGAPADDPDPIMLLQHRIKLVF